MMKLVNVCMRLLLVGIGLIGVNIHSIAVEVKRPPAPLDARFYYPLPDLTTDRSPGALAPIVDALQGKRLLFLGEQSHGAGETFRQKSALVKYLHQHQGFDVLVLESALYDVAKVWQQMQANDGKLSELSKGNLFYMYAQSAEFVELFDYIESQAKTNKPLTLVGFDSQQSGMHSQQSSIADFNLFLDKQGISLPKSLDYQQYQQWLSVLFKLEQNKPTADEFKQLSATNKLLKALIRQVPVTEENNKQDWFNNRQFWLLWLTAHQTQMERMWIHGPLTPEGNEVRDGSMSQILTWYAKDVFADKKLIVWGHDVHVGKNISEVTRFVSSRQGLNLELQKQSFTLSFLAGQGKYRDWDLKTEFDIPNAHENSLQAKLNSMNANYAFFDLSKTKQAHLAQFVLFIPQQFDISRYADGVFYLRNEVPAVYQNQQNLTESQ